MLSELETTRRVRQSSFFCALIPAVMLLSGCYNGLICSHRFAELEPPAAVAHQAGCGCGHCLSPITLPRLRHMHDGLGEDEMLEPRHVSVQPPTSRFHPVPTQPVFAPRGEYKPWEALNVKIVPIEEHAKGNGQRLAPLSPSSLPPSQSLEPIPAPAPVGEPTPAMSTRHDSAAAPTWRGFEDWDASSNEAPVVLLPALRATVVPALHEER